MSAKKSRRKPRTKFSPEVESRLLGVEQTARYLNCTIWAARKLAWDRKIAYIRIGGRKLFDKRDLDAYVEAQKVAVEASR